MAELRGTLDRLSEREHQLRLVTDTAPVAIARIDTEARYTFVNRHLAERHGLTPKQIIGRRVPEVTNKEAYALVEPCFRECVAGKPVEFEIEVPDRTGNAQFMHACFAPEWSDGKVTGITAASTM